MNTLDRTFIGVAGAVLMTALVARTVARPPAPHPVPAGQSSARPTLQRASVVTSTHYEAQAAVSATPVRLAQNTTPAEAIPAAAATAQPPAASAPTNPAESAAEPTTPGDAAPAPATSSSTPPRQGTPPARPATGSPAPAATPRAMVRRDGDIVIRNSPQGTAIYDEQRDIARITKDVRITQEGEDFVLYCQQVTYDRGRNRAVATGAVKIEGRDTTITGDRIEADFNAKVVVLTGNVDIRSRGRGDGLRSESAPVSRSKPSRMTCDRVEYNYETRDAIITGHIQMTQEDSSGTCTRIDFDEENNIITMTGNARFTDGRGRTIRSPLVKIWLDSGITQTGRDAWVEIRQRPNGTPQPRATKAPVGPVPQLPEELLREFAPPAASGTATPVPAPATAPPATPAAAPSPTP